MWVLGGVEEMALRISPRVTPGSSNSTQLFFILDQRMFDCLTVVLIYIVTSPTSLQKSCRALICVQMAEDDEWHGRRMTSGSGSGSRGSQMRYDRKQQRRQPPANTPYKGRPGYTNDPMTGALLLPPPPPQPTGYEECAPGYPFAPPPKEVEDDGEIRFEDLFYVDNKCVATLTALKKMTSMRKGLIPTVLANYIGYLFSLCYTIAYLEDGQSKYVHTFRPVKYHLGNHGLVSSYIVAELGYQIYSLGDIVYFNGLNLLCNQMVRTFNVSWDLRHKIKSHSKTDTNASFENFKLLSAQYAILSDVYTSTTTPGGVYINNEWRRAYIKSKEMTPEERNVVDRMRPEYVKKMGLLCGAVSDLIAILNTIDLEKRRPITDAKPVNINYTREHVMAAGRASYCVIFAKKTFADIKHEDTRLFITDLSAAAKAISSFMAANYYYDGGLTEFAMYHIDNANRDKMWFGNLQRAIQKQYNDLDRGPKPTTLGDRDSYDAKFRADFPLPVEDVKSTFYEYVRRIEIVWSMFDIGSNVHEKVKMKAFGSSSKTPSSAASKK